MSALMTQSRNPETVLSPICIEQLSAQTDMLIELMAGELRRHLFDNTAALGSMRHIPLASQQIIDVFIQYVSGQISQPELQAHVRTLASDGLSPMVAVLLIDKLHDRAAVMLEGVGDGAEAVLYHYRQLFLQSYIDARLNEVLTEQELYYKSSQILLQERMERERQLAVDLEKEQALALKRAVELETVATVSVDIAAILDLRELLDTVVESISDGFDLYHTHIFLFDVVQEKLALTAVAGSAAEQMLAAEGRAVLSISLHQERSLVARAARTRRSVISSDVQLDAHFMAHELLPDTRSELAIPMLVGDELLGVLDMHAADVGQFDEEDARILTLLAAQTAVALQNARQYQQRQEALENLNKLQQVMARENWQAFLADDERQIRGYMFDNEQVQPIARDIVNMNSATMPETAVFPDADIPVSIPLTVQSETIGYLDVRNPSGEPLTADEQLLLDGLSRQIADALERARLLETTELGRQELDKRAEQLAVINEVAQVVSQQLGEGELFTAVHEQVARVVVTDTFFIAMYDEAQKHFIFPYFYDDEVIHDVPPMGVDPKVETTQVWQSGKPIYVNYTPEEFWDRETEDQNLLLTGGDDDENQRPSNMAFVPLMAGAKAIGVMSVQNYQFHDFTEEDIALLFGIANHVGLALENLNLFTATQDALRQTEERSEELLLLNEISEMVSTHLDLSTLFASIGPRLQEAFAAKGIYFSLYNPSSRMMVFPYFYNPDVGIQHIPSRLADKNGGFTAEVIRTKRPLIFNSTHDESAEEEFLARGGVLEGDMRIPDTYLAVPMLAAGEVIGVIALKSFHENRRYSEDDQRLLVTLAGSISIAIQNVRQFEATERRAERERLINEISQKIQGAQTVQGAMKTAVSELGRALKIKKAVVELN